MALASFYQPLSYYDTLGGPEQPASKSAFLSAGAPLDFDIANSPDEVAGFVVLDESFIASSGSSLSNILPTRDGLMIYKVQSGDNLSKIAANFGISLNTIFWANSELKRGGMLRVDQELLILPISGVLHEIKEGETLSSIAVRYGVSADKIINHNKKISADSTIIIPGAKPPVSSVAYQTNSNLPNFDNYFAIPTVGWNWGRLHQNNAVDMANACGTSIYSSAEGLVSDVSVGWSGGYGNTLVIEHPNNTSTRYAHLREIKVEEGQYVVQGDLIGYMGNTGNTHGPTGCHLHFEVHGAQNPFAKR